MTLLRAARIALIVCGVAVTMGTALEVRERYQAEAWPFEAPLFVPPYLTARDAPLRWRFSPGTGRNSLGLRNREVEPKPPGTRRILFLGDSLIWSGETSSGELFTSVLERRFNARDARAPVEVINAGVPGYTTYQELALLDLYGLDMKPDLVVLGFVFNDLFDPYLHKPTGENSLLATDPSAFLHRFDPRGFPGALFGWSYLAHHMAFRGQRFMRSWSHQSLFAFEERIDFYLAWKDYGWDAARERIGEMHKRLAERGIPLDVLVFPVVDQVNDAFWDNDYVFYPQRRIRAICTEYGIAMLDLTEPLHRHGGVELFADYLHLNHNGNDVVADEIEAWLLSAGQ